MKIQLLCIDLVNFDLVYEEILENTKENFDLQIDLCELIWSWFADKMYVICKGVGALAADIVMRGRG